MTHPDREMLQDEVNRLRYVLEEIIRAAEPNTVWMVIPEYLIVQAKAVIDDLS